MNIEFSWRYLVMGVYVDRDLRTIRLYPLPFTRITFIFK